MAPVEDPRQDPAPSTLALPASLRREIDVVARAAAPREACGMLVGGVVEGRAEIVRLAVARNVHSRPETRYLLAAEDLLAAEREARGEGLEIVGFWHSHPVSSAEPSATDRAEAWEGYLYLIVSLAGGGEARARCWRLSGGEMVECAIEESGAAA